MSLDYTTFTVVFRGDVRKLTFNPLHHKDDTWGEVIGISLGDLMLDEGNAPDCAEAAEITRLRDELANCRAAALEEAAKVADEIDKGIWSPGTIARAIRALSPSPAAPSSPEASDQSELPPGSAGQG